MRSIFIVLDNIARGIGWPILVVLMLAVIAAVVIAMLNFVAAGYLYYIPTLQMALQMTP